MNHRFSVNVSSSSTTSPRPDFIENGESVGLLCEVASMRAQLVINRVQVCKNTQLAIFQNRARSVEKCSGIPNHVMSDFFFFRIRHVSHETDMVAYIKFVPNQYNLAAYLFVSTGSIHRDLLPCGWINNCNPFPLPRQS